MPPFSYAPVLLENDTPPKTYIHVKGDWRERGEEVQPGTARRASAAARGRKGHAADAGEVADVARASAHLARRREPHLAGVLRARHRAHVGRFRHAGRAAHRIPELLDWLASEFMERGWSMKQMVRTIVTSATYRQSSHARPELTSRDPDNTLLARQSRLRLPAELIRDEALYRGGPARSAHRRPQRPAAAAEGCRRAFVRRQREVGGIHRRGSLSPRALHSVPAHGAVSAAHELR